MKSIIFDAGPIISLATNNLLWIRAPLKKQFNGKFYITDAVKRELVDKPFETKKFKFEAIQVEKIIEDGILEVIDSENIRQQTPLLLNKANETFKAYNNYMKIVHYAEMSVIAAALEIKADAIVIDEKTTRFLIENPKNLTEIFRKTFHISVKVNESNLKEFRNTVKTLKVIRSVELVAIAFEKAILDTYMTRLPNSRVQLLESVLWGVKLNGCAVSKDEISQIMKIESR